MVGATARRWTVTSGLLALALGLVALLAVVRLSQAVPHAGGLDFAPDRLRRLAAWTGGDFTEASLQRFGAGMDPATLALAQRYAPKPAIDPAQGRSDETDPGPTLQVYRDISRQDAATLNAAIPLSKLPNPAAKPFQLSTLTPQDRTRALTCLAMAVYYEAASESTQGQSAVAQVVLNRVRHPLFPKSVCGVVFQGSSLRTGCQFTFTCDGSLARRPSDAGWVLAQKIAERALDGYVEKSVGEATHYHTQWVAPYWQPTLVKLIQIGAHIFYRWPGDSGRPPAFSGRYAGYEDAPPQVAALGPGLVQAVAVTTRSGPGETGPAQAATPVKVAMATAPAAIQVEVRTMAPTEVPKPRTSLFGAAAPPPRPRLAMPSGF